MFICTYIHVQMCKMAENLRAQMQDSNLIIEAEAILAGVLSEQVCSVCVCVCVVYMLCVCVCVCMCIDIDIDDVCTCVCR